MANHFSALKRQRQNLKRAELNRAHRSKLRHTLRGLRRAIASGDTAAAKTKLGEAVSVVDKALKKGIIKGNTAGRFKSRLAKRLAAAPAKSA